jgi:MFS family permease
LRVLFFADGSAELGSMLAYVAMPYQAYRISHSSLVVGLLSLAELAPLLLTAFVGGALADAVDRRRILRATAVGICLASGALVANSEVGRPRLWALFVVAVVLAGLDGMRRPALEASVQAMVLPEHLPATSAVMSLSTQLGGVAGPALTGVIIAVGGLVTTYSLTVAGFAVALLLMTRLGPVAGPKEDATFSLAAVRSGLAYAWRRKDLLGTYLVDINAMFFGIPNALFPQLAAHLGGPSALGVLYASPGVGSLLVTLTAGWTTRIRRYGRMIALAAAIWGLGIIGLGFSHALWQAAIALAVAGAGDMVSGLGRSTVWNQSIPDALRGRMAGIEMLSYTSGPALGNVESGLLDSLAGLRTSIVAGGVLCVAGTAVLAAALPAFRRYDAREGERLRAQPE